MDDLANAMQLLHRVRAVATWTALMREHPGGLVTYRVAAAMLGVSRRRVQELVRRGLIRTTEVVTIGTHTERFIDADSLLHAPAAVEGGRRWVQDHSTGKLVRLGGRHKRWEDRAAPFASTAGVD